MASLTPADTGERESFKVIAGLVWFGEMRRLAMLHDCDLRESGGWLSRVFVFEGKPADVSLLVGHIEALKREEEE